MRLNLPVSFNARDKSIFFLFLFINEMCFSVEERQKKKNNRPSATDMIQYKVISYVVVFFFYSFITYFDTMLIVQFVSVPSLVIAIKFMRLRRQLHSFHFDKNECIRKVALLIEQ